MAEEKDNDNTDLVRPDNRGRTTRSANLIRRGLNRLDEKSCLNSTIETASLSTPEFDQATYDKAKPLFESALSSFEEADDRTAIRELLKYLKENYGESAIAAIYRMKPYILRFVEDRAKLADKVTDISMCLMKI